MAIIDGVLPKSIRTDYSRKLLIFLLVVVVAIACIGVVAFAHTDSVLQKDTKENLEQSAQLQADAMSEWVERNRERVRAVAAAAVVQSDDADQIASHLDSELETAPEGLVALHYVDANGNVVASTTGETGSTFRTSGVEWATDVASSGFTTQHTTGPYTDPVLDGPAFAIVSPVDGADRYVVGVIDLESQSAAFDLEDESGAFTHVVDSNGVVVMSNQAHRIGQQNIESADDTGVDSMGVMRGLDGETGYVEMEMHGGLMSMGFAPVEGTDWVLMTHVRTADAFALRDEIGQLMLALLGVSLLGLGAIGWTVGRSTSQELTHLAAKAKELEDGNLDADLRSPREDEIGQLYDAFDSMRSSLRTSIEDAETAKAEAQHQRAQLESLARRLQEEAGEVMALAAEGDLRRRIDVDGGNEALDRIASEYNGMMDEIEATTARLKEFAATVASHSEEVTASAEEVQRSSESVATSVSTISERTEEQDAMFQTVSDQVNEIAATTEQIASLSDQVYEIADQTAKASEGGRTAAREAIDAMETVDDESSQTEAAITELESEIVRIEEIAELIADIAHQTNILALNANIEASRTDTGEEGFSVVAQEVKDLAQETKTSANEIEELVGDILERTEQATDEVKRTREEIVASKETVERAASAHEDISTYAEKSVEGVSEINTATQQQTASAQEIVGTVEEAARLSSEVASEASDVAAAAQEQTAALNGVTESAKDLAVEANGLQSGLDRFETSAQTATVLGPAASDGGKESGEE